MYENKISRFVNGKKVKNVSGAGFNKKYAITFEVFLSKRHIAGGSLCSF